MTFRIVTLIASATEIVHALGFGSSMVGRSHECDYPPEILHLPVCTSPKFSPDGSSYEIDQRVKAILQEAVSVYKVDAQLLEELKPTHLITQAQCEVCAVSLKDVQAAACDLISTSPQIVSLQPDSLADIWQDIHRVGLSLDADADAQILIQKLQSRMAELHNLVEGHSHPSVACIEWIEPLMAAGNWMPELIEIAGGINLFGQAGKHSPWMTWAELVDADPDYILVSPCGFDIKRTMEEMHLLQKLPGFNDLTATKENHIYVIDGNQYFNRPGPRVVESAEILVEVFHPGLLPVRHEGTGWQRVS